MYTDMYIEKEFDKILENTNKVKMEYYNFILSKKIDIITGDHL